VLFVELAKTVGTANREMLMKLLYCYIIPDYFISVIKCLYQPFTIKFTWGKNKHASPSLVGTKQGNNIALMTAMTAPSVTPSLTSPSSEHVIAYLRSQAGIP
jgi:hypothetical protein